MHAYIVNMKSTNVGNLWAVCYHVYMDLCVCYVCVQMCACLRKYICVLIYLHVFVCVRVCVHVCVRVQMCVDVYVNISVFVFLCGCVCSCGYVCVHTRVHTRVSAHVYVCLSVSIQSGHTKDVKYKS